MSQQEQEFVAGSQAHREGMPKDEPPSSYVEPRQRYQVGRDQSGPYDDSRQSHQQGVPPWAQAQRHRRAPIRFGFILMILVALALIQGLVSNAGSLGPGAAGDIFGALFGLLALVIIVPLIIVLVFLAFLLRIFRGRGRSWYRRNRAFKDGPFWW